MSFASVDAADCLAQELVHLWSAATPEARAITRQRMAAALSHLSRTDFPARGSRTLPSGYAQWRLKNGKTVSAKTALFLESRPKVGAQPISDIEILGSEGEIIGKIRKNAANQKFEVPWEPPTHIRIHRQGRSPVDWVTGGQEVPDDFRVSIGLSKRFRSVGFSGGHTDVAWNETMSVYGDLIRIKKMRKFAFRLPGREKPIESSIIYYSFRGVGIALPKTVVTGGPQVLNEIIEAFSAPVAEAVSKAGPRGRLVTVKIPVLDVAGEQQTLLELNVIREVTGNQGEIGNMSSWYFHERNFDNPRLKVPASESQ